MEKLQFDSRRLQIGYNMHYKQEVDILKLVNFGLTTTMAFMLNLWESALVVQPKSFL